MMFGYATDETENYMPLALDLSHRLLRELADLRRESKEIKYLRPDAKSQVTIEYSDDHVPQRIDTIVLSTQHDEFDEDERMLEKLDRLRKVYGHLSSYELLDILLEEKKSTNDRQRNDDPKGQSQIAR